MQTRVVRGFVVDLVPQAVSVLRGWETRIGAPVSVSVAIRRVTPDHHQMRGRHASSEMGEGF